MWIAYSVAIAGIWLADNGHRPVGIVIVLACIVSILWPWRRNG